MTTQADPELPRTRGVGILRLAQEYRQAAIAVQPSTPQFAPVSYYLHGHAIELGLKAFLVSQGSTNRALRRLGHDLRKTLKAAKKHKPFAAVTISSRDQLVVEWLSAYYRVKEFEYLEPGFKNLPQLTDVQQTSTDLLSQLKPLIDQAAKAAIAAGAP